MLHVRYISDSLSMMKNVCIFVFPRFAGIIWNGSNTAPINDFRENRNAIIDWLPHLKWHVATSSALSEYWCESGICLWLRLFTFYTAREIISETCSFEVHYLAVV